MRDQLFPLSLPWYGSSPSCDLSAFLLSYVWSVFLYVLMDQFFNPNARKELVQMTLLNHIVLLGSTLGPRHLHEPLAS